MTDDTRSTPGVITVTELDHDQALPRPRVLAGLATAYDPWTDRPTHQYDWRNCRTTAREVLCRRLHGCSTQQKTNVIRRVLIYCRLETKKITNQKL